MKLHRVILANQPPLLRGLLLRVLRKAPDIDVVGEVVNMETLRRQVEQTQPQWVIVSMWRNGKLPDLLRNLVAEYPALCLIGLAADGSQAKVHCPGLTEQAAHGMSLDSLFATLRSREPVDVVVPEVPRR